MPRHDTSRSRRRLLPILLGLTALAPGLALAAAPPRATVQSGVLEGKHMQVDGVTLNAFQGIPYAAPPVGTLRWKPPQPQAHWNGVRTATAFGPRCMQRAIFSDMRFRSNGMSEDCLYLNVWAPANASGKKLPVLVYFFGGGFIAGDGSEYRYDGASLAARGIVTVTVNYRLGVFGFLALPALSAESPHHASGNYGLLDQNAALRWVRANITAFGGDPNRITIGGESAGSISVHAQMASPLSRKLIAGAIGESGALIAPISPLPLSAAEQRGTQFMKQVDANSLKALRAMPAQALLQATGAKDAVSFDPDIDGYFLTEPPVDTFGKGQQARVPLLVGSNSQEGFYTAILRDAAPTPANYKAALHKLFGAQASAALKLYPGHNAAQVKRSATALAGDMFIAHSTWRWMNQQRQTGNAPVYYYYFDQARPLKRDAKPGDAPDPGAVHSGEIEYALGNLDSNPVYAWTAADRKVSRIMESYFANFIRTGDPNGRGLPVWPAVRKARGGLLRQHIGTPTRSYPDQNTARQHFLTTYFAHRPSAL
ncbi:carboxylesterase/lipase family protein [Oleiagrimonas soli]|uniref:Carboxylic ester hydrolase n=1 Tax=Oleiagrimonas soli TaxID=1543381 RepID=A0A099CYL4_9GAMM|nr:carboxylesterase family protein [Oleiagrimonas soli]KGI78110.1 carboxylesterase [Oleiagrimonas soli]MBB6183455.1 para-nitrobenzyl esterase [Oleiagrimonas soli]